MAQHGLSTSKMASRESDIALWLHNKLGSTDDLWSGKSICSQFSQERLLHIHECFPNLQPHVKVKLLLSFMHLPRRNIEEWKVDLDEIIDLAINDGDQWVSTVADIAKVFPATGNINFDVNNSNTAFHEVLNDLRKVAKKTTDSSMLALECQYVNRSSLNILVGQLPVPPKHFALKRKPKSAALRAEILQKSLEAASNTNKKSNSVPIKSRSFAKRMDDTAPMKGLSSRSGMFRTPPTNRSLTIHPAGPFGQRTPHTNIKKEGGIKLLDITEQPVGMKEAKRRRRQAEMEAMETAKKEKAAEPTMSINTTPDYAAGLMSPAPSVITNNTSLTSSPLPSTPSYVPPSSSLLPTTANISGPLPTPISVSKNTQSAREYLQHQLQQQLGPSSLHTQRPAIPTAITSLVKQPKTIVVQPPSTTQEPAAVPSPISSPAVGVTQTTNQPQPAKTRLSLTKDQMVAAQEMFRTSNKVTRPEKALIIGFMAGARDNPCPEHGAIVNVRLSEDIQKVVKDDGTVNDMIVDTYFQMNYETGRWQRVQKYRDILAADDVITNPDS